jgi:hypothetical protein
MGKIDTWDYQWIFSCWIHGGLTIIPEVNLVRNIGFGSEDATHTKKVPSRKQMLPECTEIKFPLRHPKLFVRCFIADRYTDKKYFGIKTIIIRFLRIPCKLAKIFKLKLI